MKKGRNEFLNKFQLLNTQENSQEIIWSSSDSSDYENLYCNERIENRKPQVDSRKRKRVDRRNKSLKNISNLDITYVDNENNIKEKNNTSPILRSKISICSSPILFSSQQQKGENPPSKHKHNSPILSFPQGNGGNMKSPILLSKCKSPKYSPKIKKKLFNNKYYEEDLNYNNLEKNNDNCDLQGTERTKRKGKFVLPLLQDKQEKECNIIINKSQEMISDRCNKDLVKIVKSYFDNHFSLETNSQISISECESTPKNTSKTSEEIDIISLSDDNEISNIELKRKDTVNDEIVNTKMLKYKKDGMAYRLHVLLRKQNASISLWHYEKFLANNSKFAIPKGDYTAFRILSVKFKYGCYVIESSDVNNDNYCILISNIYVNNAAIETNMLLKLYKPYRVMSANNCKLIVNVFKFECYKMSRIQE